ncbi:hypothetical protein BJ508DRAFT_324435 [Ascobolus immersus RN42]|uniref:Dolichyl-diphosphooligosaccharide-protein glycosyltransferase subunit OST5 n=1 Tax=Ascobolus immersus RN42 TaxID=1160509 RepID=A0A3N4ICA0_ASCIM|nr:hypothetical protein BJ508DRAFT_324435 [Ascobolus immersus RN42]
MSSMEAVYAASKESFEPIFSKTLQFPVAAALVTSGLLATGFFSVSKNPLSTLASAIAASTALGFGAVYLICAVGVYV